MDGSGGVASLIDRRIKETNTKWQRELKIDQRCEVNDCKIDDDDNGDGGAYFPASFGGGGGVGIGFSG